MGAGTPGRDDSRYTKECWLCTLGALHPGVLVMWQTHIRDLSPTAEAVRGAACQGNKVTLVDSGRQKVVSQVSALM